MKAVRLKSDFHLTTHNISDSRMCGTTIKEATEER